MSQSRAKDLTIHIVAVCPILSSQDDGQSFCKIYKTRNGMIVFTKSPQCEADGYLYLLGSHDDPATVQDEKPKMFLGSLSMVANHALTIATRAHDDIARWFEDAFALVAARRVCSNVVERAYAKTHMDDEELLIHFVGDMTLEDQDKFVRDHSITTNVCARGVRITDYGNICRNIRHKLNLEVNVHKNYYTLSLLQI